MAVETLTPRGVRLRAYLELSKSGIVALVLISVGAGYLCGQSLEEGFSLARFFTTLFGILFLASGSSALNQLQEQEEDALMARTRKRPLPSGKMSNREVGTFVSASILLGLFLLWQLSSAVFGLGVLAIILYNGLYTLWWKRKWAYAAVPGAVPGALPILMGYASARGAVFTSGGIFLFLLLFYWQMPHFWVLALKYSGDYKDGGFPTLPVARGHGVTVQGIVIWGLGYVGLALLGAPFLAAHNVYLVGSFLVSASVLFRLYKFAKSPDAETSREWLKFFLAVNFSLILYLAAAVLDAWSVYFMAWWQTR